VGLGFGSSGLLSIRLGCRRVGSAAEFVWGDIGFVLMSLVVVNSFRVIEGML